jgi:hypothetical protein
VRAQIEHGPYERDDLFGDGNAGARIAEVLSSARPPIQKRLSYDLEELRAMLAGASS